MRPTLSGDAMLLTTSYDDVAITTIAIILIVNFMVRQTLQNTSIIQPTSIIVTLADLIAFSSLWLHLTIQPSQIETSV